jgi:putative ABC transport system permease protein
MKFIPLIWAMLWRKKVRTSLTLLSILIAFLLFGMLQGVNSAFKETIARSNVNRLVVTNKISITESLPYAYMQQIEALPGVERVSHESWFGPYYQDPKNFVAAFPVEPEREFPAHPEYQVPKDQLTALENTRDGAIVGAGLAKKYGWKIGDHIPLHSTITVPGSETTPSVLRSAGNSRSASPRPSSAATMHNVSDCTSTSTSMRVSLKPNVLSTASSGTCSRTACMTVLPTANSNAKNTANKM